MWYIFYILPITHTYVTALSSLVSLWPGHSLTASLIASFPRSLPNKCSIEHATMKGNLKTKAQCAVMPDTAW